MPGLDVGEHGRRVEVARAGRGACRRSSSARARRRPRRATWLVAGRRAGRRAPAARGRRRRRSGSPTVSAATRLDEAALELVGDGVVDDEALGRDAALAAVDEARPCTATARRASRSASASTMNGSEPPSSSTLFLSAVPAAAATAAPARSLPVSVTAATRGSSMIRGGHVRPTLGVATSSAGEHARRAGPPSREHLPRSPARSRGTFGACLSSAALPAISAGAAKRKTCQNGKFHGMIASTTPSGS